MPLILRPVPMGGKRVFHIDQSDLDALIASGEAVQCPGYDIFEMAHEEERTQGYMTRDMRAIAPPSAPRKAGRPPKVRTEAAQ